MDESDIRLSKAIKLNYKHRQLKRAIAPRLAVAFFFCCYILKYYFSHFCGLGFRDEASLRIPASYKMHTDCFANATSTPASRLQLMNH